MWPLQAAHSQLAPQNITLTPWGMALTYSSGILAVDAGSVDNDFLIRPTHCS